MDLRPLQKLATEPAHQLRLVQIAAASGLLAGILLTRPLWTSVRLYPLAPLLNVFPPFESPADTFILTVLICGLVASVFGIAPKVASPLVTVVGALLCIQDQNRLHPWVVEYLLCFGLLSLHATSNSERSSLTVDRIRLLLFFVYFWGGAQKLNEGFMYKLFPWFIEPLVGEAAAKSELMPYIAASAALIECGLALLLLIPSTRRAAVTGLCLMHLFILAAIGPWGLGYNQSVWPWNLVMLVVLPVLFSDKSPSTFFRGIRDDTVRMALSLVCGFLPLFGYAGWWDIYLSFGMYNGNMTKATVFLSVPAYGRLPAPMRELTERAEDGSHFLLRISNWSLGELGTPPNPELRLLRAAGERLCMFAEQPFDIIVSIRDRSRFFVKSSQEEVLVCEKGLLRIISPEELGLASGFDENRDF